MNVSLVTLFHFCMSVMTHLLLTYIIVQNQCHVCDENGEFRFFSRGCTPNLIFLAGGASRTSIFYQVGPKVIYQCAFPQPKSHLGVCSVCHFSRGVPLSRRRDYTPSSQLRKHQFWLSPGFLRLSRTLAHSHSLS